MTNSSSQTRGSSDHIFSDDDYDYGYNDDEVDVVIGRMWSAASASRIFEHSWIQFTRYATMSDNRVETMITRWSQNNQKEKLAEDRAFEAWIQPRIERHAGFRALNAYLASLGIEPSHPIGYQEYSGQFGTYGFHVRREHLPALERRAQDDVGLTTETDRAEAAENFRIFILRHYADDAEANRRSLPGIDVSPYRPRDQTPLPRR